jgi:hypothetical protein
MDDVPSLIEAYLAGARQGVAPGGLYVEGDVLYLDGWWQAAFRLATDAYLVQAEPPPSSTHAIELLQAGLARRGLQTIPGEHPLVHAVTYAELSLTGVEWTLWASDAERGQTALTHRTAPETAPDVGWSASAPSVWDHPAAGDVSADFAASLQAGMPPSVVLAVGLDPERVAELEAVVPDCRVQAADLGGAVAACGATVPHLVIADAATEDGRRFLLEFRAEACGRHVPVAAVADDAGVTGADVTLDAAVSPAAWGDQLRALLPEA